MQTLGHFQGSGVGASVELKSFFPSILTNPTLKINSTPCEPQEQAQDH
jgi:hypothetical protein